MGVGVGGIARAAHVAQIGLGGERHGLRAEALRAKLQAGAHAAEPAMVRRCAVVVERLCEGAPTEQQHVEEGVARVGGRQRWHRAARLPRHDLREHRLLVRGGERRPGRHRAVAVGWPAKHRRDDRLELREDALVRQVRANLLLDLRLLLGRHGGAERGRLDWSRHLLPGNSW